jgi:hypothetical protein
LAVGGVFIVVSIGVRMRNREWLRRAGPFEISESRLHQSEDEADFWRQAALSSREEADALRDDLRQSEELLRGIRKED